MSLFEWNDSFCVDHKLLDEQHKKYPIVINMIDNALKTNNIHAVGTEVFKRLDDYIDEHFSTEENLMEKHGFSGYEAHKKEHEDFTKKIKEFENKVKEQNGIFKEALAVELNEFLIEWFYFHMRQVDMKYRMFFDEKCNNPD